MIIIIIISVCIVVLLLGFLYKYYKKFKDNQLPKLKEKKVKKTKKKSKIVTVKNVNLTLVENFMVRKEVLFWKYLNSILPRNFLAIPRVALNSLVLPDGDKTIYNLVVDKTLDFVIFEEKDMHPVLVIDIYDKSYNDEKLDEQDPYLIDILKKLEIKVLQILVSNNFNKDEAKQQIFKELNISTDKSID